MQNNLHNTQSQREKSLSGIISINPLLIIFLLIMLIMLRKLKEGWMGVVIRTNLTYRIWLPKGGAFPHALDEGVGNQPTSDHRNQSRKTNKRENMQKDQ